MKTSLRLLAPALFVSAFLVASANGQLTLNDPYEIRSDSNNGRLSQSFNSGEPFGIYSYASQAAIEARPAGSNPTRRMSAAIFYFQLPELETGLSIANASLSFWLSSTPLTGPGEGNLDLYGLGFSSDPSIDAGSYSDFWHMGPNDDRAGLGISSVVKLQDDVVVASDYPNGVASTNPESAPGPINFMASDNLNVFLNSVYEVGAQAGDYAVFRLSYNTLINPNGSIVGYNVHGSGLDSAATDPMLSFIAIPEPSTYALFGGLAALVVAGFIRRRSLVRHA